MEYMSMRTGLDIASALFGLVAAYFWFCSADALPAPPIGTYYDVVDSSHSPFAEKWTKASRLNEIAAGFTGLATLLAAVAQFLPA